MTPDDIKRVALPALRHRIALAPDALLEGRKPERPAERESSRPWRRRASDQTMRAARFIPSRRRAARGHRRGAAWSRCSLASPRARGAAAVAWAARRSRRCWLLAIAWTASLSRRAWRQSPRAHDAAPALGVRHRRQAAGAPAVRERRRSAAGAARSSTTADPSLLTDGLPARHRRSQPASASRSPTKSRRRGAAKSTSRPPTCACARGWASANCWSALGSTDERGVSIPTSRRWRATPGWPATGGCRKSASRPTSSAAKAPTSSNSPNTATAIRCGTSTGRRRCASSKPILREFQDERDQCVMLLIDCGRRMRADDRQARHRQRALRPGAERGDAAVVRGAAAGRRGRRA